MKRIEAINGYTIYETTKRDEKDGYSVGTFVIYFSSDIRELGRENSYSDWECDSLAEAEAWALGGNYARAKEIVEETTTAAGFEEIAMVEAALNAGMSDDEAAEVLEAEEDPTNKQVISDNEVVFIKEAERVGYANLSDSDKDHFDEITLAAEAVALNIAAIFEDPAPREYVAQAKEDLLHGATLWEAYQDLEITVEKEEAQTITSASTSINSAKAPAVYGMPAAVELMRGRSVIDVGGGRYDTGVEAAKAYGARVAVYDPYNRTPEHNAVVLGRGYDVAVVSNVLNVINSPAARRDVLTLAAAHAGVVLVTVYEGDGSGVGRQTGADAWQENRKTAGYMVEISAALPGYNVKRSGRLIIAQKPAGKGFKTSYTTPGAITGEAKFTKSGNIKLGTSTWVLSKLFGRFFYHIVDGDGDIVEISGSCGKFCEGCGQSVDGKRPACYVAKSYRYPSVVQGHANNSLAFRLDLAGAFDRLRGQLRRARKLPGLVRINQSGELESAAEFLAWCELAAEFPAVNFFLYTKAFEYVEEAILSGQKPANLIVNVSIWHEYGVEEWNRLKDCAGVNAFVYDDGYDYAALSIYETARCHAYNEAGKLDHEITCERCGLCWRRGGRVIFCKDHN